MLSKAMQGAVILGGIPGGRSPAEVDHKVLKELLQEATSVLLSYVTPEVTCLSRAGLEYAQGRYRKQRIG